MIASLGEIPASPPVPAARVSVRLRRAEPEDEAGIYTLYEAVFGSGWGGEYRRRRRWCTVENLYPELTREWVLTAGDQVVGFLGAVPLPYRIGGRTLIAHSPSDYMVLPQYRFHGLKLMKECFKVCPDCISCDDIEVTIKVNEWLGAQPAGEMHRYTRLLDARGLRKGQLARIPTALYAPATLGLRLLEAIHPVGLPAGYVLKEVDGFDSRFDRLCERILATLPVSPVRDARFLQWRYGAASPHAASRVAVVERGDGELAGYAVYYSSRGQAHGGYVFDLQSEGPERSGVAKALLGHCTSRLRSDGCWLAHYYQVDSPHAVSREVLRALGFYRRTRHILFVRLADPELQRLAGDASNWHYVFGDGEGSHAYV